MKTTIERVCQLERWLTNAGICCDCGSELHHHIEEPFATCSGCGRGSGEWTSQPPTIQRLRMQVASTKEPKWLPTPQECDAYAADLMPIERRDYLVGKRASLLERIHDIEGRHPSYPDGSLASLVLINLKDDLAAVESALGYPEPKEPEEA